MIITATSNPIGNTVKCAQALAKSLNATVLSLDNYQISFYDYQHKNKDDDFLAIAERMSQCDLIVYASPVYWYAMSAQMKVFFDRLSDLMTVRKPLGRKLKNIRNAVISTGAQACVPDCFVEPFKLTAEYFEMEFLGNFYLSMRQDTVRAEGDRLAHFIARVSTTLQQRSVVCA